MVELPLSYTYMYSLASFSASLLTAGGVSSAACRSMTSLTGFRTWQVGDGGGCRDEVVDVKLLLKGEEGTSEGGGGGGGLCGGEGRGCQTWQWGRSCKRL